MAVATPCDKVTNNVSLTLSYEWISGDNPNPPGDIDMPYIRDDTVWGDTDTGNIEVVWDGTNYVLKVKGQPDKILTWRCKPDFKAVVLGIALDGSGDLYDIIITIGASRTPINPIYRQP